jgi:hypothetical protein
MRTRTLHASPYARRQSSYGMQYEEKLTFEIDRTAVIDLTAASISASDWVTDQTGLITLSGETTTGNSVFVTVEAISTGVAVLKNTTTFNSGEKEIRIFRLDISETDDRGDR